VTNPLGPRLIQLATTLLQPPWLFLIVGALVLLAYGPGLRGGFVSDDLLWLNRAVYGEHGGRASLNFQHHRHVLPLEIALWNLKFQLLGFQAWAYHLFALFGHALACFCFYGFARGIGISGLHVGAATAAASVAGAPSQAVFWVAGDIHVWATVAVLASLILYVRYRGQGGALRLAGAIGFAAAAALLKTEATVVPLGVIAYELFWHRPATRWSARTVRRSLLRLAPFVGAVGLFLAWVTTADKKPPTRLGWNVVTRLVEYLQMIALPYDPLSFVGRFHGLGWMAATLAFSVAALVLICLAAWLRLSVAGLWLIWVGSLLPILLITEDPQSRYVYLATLVASAIAVGGALQLFRRLSALRLGEAPFMILVALVFVTVLAVEVMETNALSSNLRAAEKESLALRSAVLAHHPTLPEGSTIILIGHPMDAGSASAVFLDPRLGPLTQAEPPVIEFAPSLEAVVPKASGAVVFIYEREAPGRYVERVILPGRTDGG
jgi:hypothetical protein